MLDGRSLRRCEVLILTTDLQCGRATEDARILFHFLGCVAKQIELLLHRNCQRIFFVRSFPARPVGFDRRQLHRLRLNGRIRASDDGGFSGDARDFFGCDDGRRGESPGAVDDHADADAEARILENIGYGQGLIAAALRRQPQSDALVTQPDNSDVAIARLGFLGLAQGDVAQFLELRRRRLGIRGRRKQTASERGGSRRRGSGNEVSSSEHTNVHCIHQRAGSRTCSAP